MGSTPQGPAGLPPSGQPQPMQAGDYTPAAKNRDVHFAAWGADPPALRYVTLDDTLIVGTLSNTGGLGVNVNVRIQPPHEVERPLQYAVAGAGSNVIQRKQFTMREGFLLSATISAQAALTAGQYIYAWLALNRVANAVANDFDTLWAGYLLGTTALGFPESVPQRPTDGPGTLVYPTPGNPAAGADITFVLGSNTRMRILAFGATLTTSVTVANRTPVLRLDNGPVNVAFAPSPAAQAASLAIQYGWGPLGYAPALVSTFQGIGGPFPVDLGPNGHVATVTANIQTTDQWSAVGLLALQWADLL